MPNLVICEGMRSTECPFSLCTLEYEMVSTSGETAAAFSFSFRNYDEDDEVDLSFISVREKKINTGLSPIVTACIVDVIIK